MNAQVDQLLEPSFGEQLVDIRLADARGYAGQKPLIEAIPQAAERFVENVLLAAALVTDNFPTFDADKRRDIADAAELRRYFFGNELAIGEDLEITARMRLKQFEQLRIHERLAAKNTEETVPVRLGIFDQVVECGQIDRLAWRLHINPAAWQRKLQLLIIER